MQLLLTCNIDLLHVDSCSPHNKIRMRSLRLKNSLTRKQSIICISERVELNSGLEEMLTTSAFRCAKDCDMTAISRGVPDVVHIPATLNCASTAGSSWMEQVKLNKTPAKNGTFTGYTAIVTWGEGLHVCTEKYTELF